MAKRAIAAILICAVMVLVGAVPLAMAATEIIKGEKGPNASAVTWEYVPQEYGIWTGHIVNNGLRWVVIDVYDNTIGVPEEKSHERIRFAAYGAYPAGELDTRTVTMASGHVYEITATPNGPRGSSCTVEDMFKPAIPPMALFSVDKDNLKVVVDATDSYDLDGYIVSYAWDFGDHSSIVMGSPATYTYAAGGTYPITLTVTDNDGLTGELAQEVTVVPPLTPPVAKFLAPMNWMVVSADASASSDADGTLQSYTWNWGDGSASEELTVSTASHTYLVEKTYTITLTVTDNDGLTDQATSDVIARMPHPPVARFSAPMDWMVVNADASASSDADGTIQSYTWNWGDESALEVLTVSTASHTYLVEKAYTITLTVTDNDGLTGDATADVVARMPHPPVAKFTAVVTHFDVAVDASASSDADGTIQSYTWNWGDESALEVLTVSTASHTYLDKGTYTITLTVKDNDGLSESAQEVVNIIDNFPQASFTSSATGLTVTVNAGGSSDDYGIVSYTWDWGDGSAPEVLTTSTASHTYTAPASVLAVVTSQHVVVASGTAPGPPYPVAGYTRDSAGAILPSCTVTITDVNTGEYTTVLSGTNGFYSVNLGGFAAWTAGDIVKVTAVKGTLAGENQGTVAGTYLALDVKLIETGSPPFDVVITLTVTDTIGQTTTVQETVTIYP